MLAEIATALLGALIFAVAGVAGIAAAKAMMPHLEPLEDAPPPTLDVPPVALVVGAAVVGAALGFQTPPLDQLVITAVAVLCLTAIWFTDSQTGIIPDVFSLGPLAIVLVYGFFRHDLSPLFSAIVLFIPFAVLALISKGRGMGWGDAKLAALGGALLGVSNAVVAFVLASLVAALAAWLKHRRRNAPIAMGPYLVAAIAASLPFTS